MAVNVGINVVGTNNKTLLNVLREGTSRQKRNALHLLVCCTIEKRLPGWQSNTEQNAGTHTHTCTKI